MLGGGRKLIYFKRKNNRTTQVFGTTPISIRSYIFDPDVFFPRCIVLVEGPGDAASFYAISDALSSVLEQFNIHVVDSGGVGNIDPYIQLATAFNIPYIGMVDSEYNGQITQSADFYVLPGKLENELASIGLDVKTEVSIDPDKAYEKVFDAMGKQGTRKKIHESNLGKVFDRALSKIHENPKEIWKRV
jgi:predicted ATP-dependent endonuclease of OLD family